MVVTSPFIGLIYDMMGRRLTVIISFCLIGAGLVLVPFSAPNITFASLARGLMGIGIQMQISNPMINDYVKRDSRGKAFILNNVGYVLGETFAMAVLFQLTNRTGLDPFIAFCIVASIIGGFGFLILPAIVED